METLTTCEVCDLEAPEGDHPCAFEHACSCWRGKPCKPGTQPGQPLLSPDIDVSDFGSVVLLTGLTEAGRDWLTENVAHEESVMWAGGYVCEPRYVQDIIDGATNDEIVVAL